MKDKDEKQQKVEAINEEILQINKEMKPLQDSLAAKEKIKRDLTKKKKRLQKDNYIGKCYIEINLNEIKYYYITDTLDIANIEDIILVGYVIEQRKIEENESAYCIQKKTVYLHDIKHHQKKDEIDKERFYEKLREVIDYINNIK